MIIAILVLIFALAALFIIGAVKKMNFTIAGFVFVVLTFFATVGICIGAPQMHKTFSINIIDYLIKFNDDGSMSTTKQTTQTVIQRQQQGTQK
ncbi:hypothetical protein IKP85_01325 [bacterium]|nr:hypothetical protein [bacterium]